MPQSLLGHQRTLQEVLQIWGAGEETMHQRGLLLHVKQGGVFATGPRKNSQAEFQGLSQKHAGHGLYGQW